MIKASSNLQSNGATRRISSEEVESLFSQIKIGINGSFDRCQVYWDQIKRLKESLDSDLISIKTGQSHLNYLNDQSKEILESIEVESKKILNQISSSSSNQIASKSKSPVHLSSFPSKKSRIGSIDSKDISKILRSPTSINSYEVENEENDYYRILKRFNPEEKDQDGKNSSKTKDEVEDKDDEDGLIKFDRKFQDSNSQLNQARLKLQELSDSIEKAINKQRSYENQLSQNALRIRKFILLISLFKVLKFIFINFKSMISISLSLLNFLNYNIKTRPSSLNQEDNESENSDQDRDKTSCGTHGSNISSFKLGFKNWGLMISILILIFEFKSFVFTFYRFFSFSKMHKSKTE